MLMFDFCVSFVLGFQHGRSLTIVFLKSQGRFQENSQINVQGIEKLLFSMKTFQRKMKHPTG